MTKLENENEQCPVGEWEDYARSKVGVGGGGGIAWLGSWHGCPSSLKDGGVGAAGFSLIFVETP